MAMVESKAQLDRFMQALKLHTRSEYVVRDSHAGSAQCGYVKYQCTHGGKPQWEERPGVPRADVKRERSSRKTSCESKVLVHVPKTYWSDFNWAVGESTFEFIERVT